MIEKEQTKINQTMRFIPTGTVVPSSFLFEKGISYSLQNVYKKNNWLTDFGNGAFYKLDDNITLTGALYGVQKKNLSFHIGGISALSLLGINHNIAFNRKMFIYGTREEIIPHWFLEHYKNDVNIVKTIMLPNNIGLVEYDEKTYKIKISGIERAILEAIYLYPKFVSIREVYQLLESITVLKLTIMQELLEKCSSVKVKRLFLYLAETINAPWFSKLDINKINLGSGKRSFEKGGKLINKYNIVIGDVTNI